MFNYQKAFFDPEALKLIPVASAGPAAARDDWAFEAAPAAGDAAEAQRVFVFMEEAVLALNIALATGRPLLVSGEPGGGKTSLALFAAQVLERRFYRQTITSRTQVTDLLASYDAIGRLGDAQRKVKPRPDQAYLTPGALWWALNPETARWRGVQARAGVELVDDRCENPDGTGALLLLDEIDKADPDVPNDLLEVLDERTFTIPETREKIGKQKDLDLLIVLTTNGERELPAAFLRRCVTIQLPEPPGAAWLVDVARRRFPIVAAPAAAAEWEALYLGIAKEVMNRRERAEAEHRRKPSIAEFLDAVAACRELASKRARAAAANEPKEAHPDLKELLDWVLIKDGARGAGR